MCLSIKNEITFIYLSQNFLVDTEVQTQGLWVIVQYVLQTVVHLHIHTLHVFKDHLLPQHHLVERSNEESYKHDEGHGVRGPLVEGH